MHTHHGAKNSTTLGIWLPSTVFEKRCESTSFTLLDAEYSASAPWCGHASARLLKNSSAVRCICMCALSKTQAARGCRWRNNVQDVNAAHV